MNGRSVPTDAPPIAPGRSPATATTGSPPTAPDQLRRAVPSRRTRRARQVEPFARPNRADGYQRHVKWVFAVSALTAIRCAAATASGIATTTAATTTPCAQGASRGAAPNATSAPTPLDTFVLDYIPARDYLPQSRAGRRASSRSWRARWMGHRWGVERRLTPDD